MLIPRHIPALDDATLRAIATAAAIFLRKVPSYHLNMDRDDLVQELTLYVISKMDAYDPTLGAWHTFVNCIVKRKLASIRRSLKSPNNRMNFEARSFEQCDEELRDLNREYVRSAEEAVSPRRSSEERRSDADVWETKIDIETLIVELDPGLRDLCKQLMQIRSRTEACKIVGLSRSTLYRRLHKVKHIFIESSVTR